MKTILILLCAAMSIAGQYQLEQSVVANGGGHVYGGSYSGTTTIGQPVVGGFITFGASAEYTGFWSPALAPTAAGVSITGRVLAPGGVGLNGATLYLTQARGETLIARSSSLGYYQFDDVEVGQTIMISVSSKRFEYAPRSLSVQDSLTDIDFSPLD